MRVSKRIVAEQFVPTSTTPCPDIGLFRLSRKSLGVTGRITTFDPDTKVYSSLPQTLYQSGIPFWIPPGDGSSTGFRFSGTRGVFTLSLEAPMASVFNAFVSGGYCYLPAGAGGLATGGWYWFKMADGGNGEVFAERYSGSGQPVFYPSPTALPNLTAGRITQITTEITGPSFVMPGGSMGPNGIQTMLLKHFTTSSAGAKVVRVKLGSTNIIHWSMTASFNDQVNQISRQNMGVENRQIGNRSAGASATIAGAWDCGTSATTYLGDVTTIDTSVDQIVSFTGAIAVNTDSIVLIPMQFTVQYGA